MNSLLDKIIKTRKQSLADRRKTLPFARLREEAEVMPSPKGRFLEALTGGGNIRVIGEIKKASPSKGILCRDFDPLKIASLYRAGGASALSVLTEADYFMGSDEILRKVVHNTDIPVLRKDFIIDEYQVFETRFLGASAFLLITGCLDNSKLANFIQTGHALGLTALVEVHHADEVERALTCGASLIGINNRDLSTFRTNLDTTFQLRKLIPDRIPVVSESGIHCRDDILRLRTCKVQAALIGEAFMRNPSQIPKLLKMMLSAGTGPGKSD